MAQVSFSPVGNGAQFFDTNGKPLNGGKLYTYAAGLSGTNQATYTTNAGTVQNSNPIVMNSDGRPPQEIWLVQGSAYLFELKDSAGNLLASYDNLVGINDISSTSYAAVQGTFVPTLLFNGAGTGNVYGGSNLAQYIKIPFTPGGSPFASLVHCWVQLALASKGSATGNASIGGLPFAIAIGFTPSTNQPAAGAVNTNLVTFAVTSDKVVTIGLGAGNVIANLWSTPGSGAAGPNPLTDASFTTGSSVFASFIYPTAS